MIEQQIHTEKHLSQILSLLAEKTEGVCEPSCLTEELQKKIHLMINNNEVTTATI